ncbi:histidinol-phosphate transaminase [Virgibacillus halodenitrificans]|uniref:Histidinol-phosphate aminotransferase n=1 Tax=Virgibacillus halodenitrificans TaxID=1482 RepID=A0ABR7VPZ7_VIRHA|nr:histidinol-phosphate transaminase [Virgibacillus halodenitrificans]MBD1222607.1 histidinol-phosphate transaminase [Virgibacillus halodenitrificans]MYL56888.1 histidinol-phosphate transaminase [Virgibacillus halodenitrificans]
MEGKPVLEQLSAYKPGKQVKDIQNEYGLSRIVKLASNENPYGFSKKVETFLTDNIKELNIYPDGNAGELRKTVADKWQVTESQLVFGSGSDEIVQMLCRAFLAPGLNTVMATPTFPQYRHHALIEGAEVKEVPTIEGKHNLEQMLQMVNENTKIMWLCSPNNPTGGIISKNQLHEFMLKCPKHVLIVLDEAYYEYLSKEFDPSAITLLSQHKNLIILRTFSKAYGLAGLRVGYGIADESVISKLNVVRGPFNTSSIAQKAAVIAIQDESFLDETLGYNVEVKHDFEKFLDQIKWGYYPTETNFILVKTPISGMEVFDFLLKRGFIVRPGELLGCPQTVRITLGQKDDMKELQRILYELEQQVSKER